MENRKELFGHPMGLFVLFFTEMWERFSYYGMRAILVLYMVESTTVDNAGLGWEKGDALALYGWYTMLVYVMSIPGGIIADKFLGQKRAVLIGGLILVAGHSVLAIEQPWAFYTGLALIVLGVGGLKPNISTMVGGLYKQGDIRRDMGFTIFYIGINVGAAASALLVGWLGQTHGWHYGFGLAGIGMLLGQVVYMAGQKHLEGVGEPPTEEEKRNSDDSLGRLFKKMLSGGLPLIVYLLCSALSVYILVDLSIGYGLLGLFLSLVVGLMMSIYRELNEEEKDRFLVLLISFLIVIVFWGAFEQAGGLMNIYTEEKVNRTLMGYEIPASVFQSVNAIFIILFGTAVAKFWAWKKRKGKESSSLYKMAIGTIVMGIGFLFMAKASLEVLSSGEAALVWIILAYLFHTIGELSASPVALSFITKLAPVKYVSIMMGVYFAATGLGNKVAGAIGESAQMENAKVEMVADYDYLNNTVHDTILDSAKNFTVQGHIYPLDGEYRITDTLGNPLVGNLISLSDSNWTIIRETMEGEEEATQENPYHVNILFENEKELEKLKIDSNHDVNIKKYEGTIEVFEVANQKELKTFIMITIITGLFGFVLILFLKKLKKLTHGIEEREGKHDITDHGEVLDE